VYRDHGGDLQSEIEMSVFGLENTGTDPMLVNPGEGNPEGTVNRRRQRKAITNYEFLDQAPPAIYF